MVKSQGLSARHAQGHVLALPITDGMVLSEFLISEAQLLHL